MTNPTNNDSPEELANLEAKRSHDKPEAGVAFIIQHIWEKCYNVHQHPSAYNIPAEAAGEQEYATKFINDLIKSQTTETTTDDRANTEPKRELAPQQGSESTKLDDLANELANYWWAEEKYTPNGRWEECKAEATRQLLEWSRQERIDEHRILDELAESTANVNPDTALDDYADAKAKRLVELQSPQETKE